MYVHAEHMYVHDEHMYVHNLSHSSPPPPKKNPLYTLPAFPPLKSSAGGRVELGGAHV